MRWGTSDVLQAPWLQRHGDVTEGVCPRPFAGGTVTSRSALCCYTPATAPHANYNEHKLDTCFSCAYDYFSL